MSPSYGEPNAHDTTASTGTAPASSQISPTCARDSSTVMCTFFSLYVGDAEIVTVISSTSASSAIDAPFTLGTRAVKVTPGRRSRAATTSAAPAIDGTALGDTNEQTSI